MKNVVALAGRVALIIVTCCALVSCQNEQKPATSSTAASKPVPPTPSKRQQLLNMEVRALYITSWTAGINRFQTLTDMVSRSHLNAVVIDIKDSTGKVGYDSAVPLVAQTGAYEKRIRNLDAILQQCRDKKIYTIARIAVFQDPNLAKARPDLAVGGGGQKVWKDRKGLAWVDPASKTVWDYNLAIAKEAAAKGFDEIQFDYVRFPTDGKLKTMTYPVYKRDVPKHEIIRRFFQYVDQQMKPVDVMTSADIFGLTTMVDDDMNIGQRIQDVADYVDFVCPMIYPSHYPTGHLGLKNPAEHPYRVIYDACLRGAKRLEGKRAKMRPWLQDFKLGAAYDKKMIIDQIQAARDAKVFGFSMWNARNVYTDAAYLEKLPEPNPVPPLRDQVLEDIRRHDAARLAMQNRSTSIRQEKPSIHKPRRKAKGN
ncbi:putative glycoside hydrolase [Oryzomonas rubra]|uniref:GTP-binding protein n=1 Tax=Oryzomonas rubra TaxID=2509454 RepID=A0A5A9XKU2_9BACT|nr:putative glycoside hydrolase [Oryzomonas rubra]KAA0893390.1 GTP-binding protein [Oryzomonas rubra]